MSCQVTSQRDEKGHPNIQMVLENDSHDDTIEYEDDDRGSIWRRTILGVQNGRMSSTFPIGQSALTSFCSSTFSTRTRGMESFLKTSDPDMDNSN
jgi:hypothetical protein